MKYIDLKMVQEYSKKLSDIYGTVLEITDVGYLALDTIRG